MIKLCSSPDEFSQIYNIINLKKRIAARNLDSLIPKEEFIEKYSKNFITHAYFENDKIIAYITSKLLKEIPSWYVFLLGTNIEQKSFKLENTKIPEVMDAALEHWESRGINSFVFLQSRSHRSHINGENISQFSDRVKNYTNPAPTLEIVKKGEKSKFSLINNSICRDTVYPTDVVIKWSFRKDCFKDYD